MRKLLYQRKENAPKITFVHAICWALFIFSEIGVSGLIRNNFSSFSYYFTFYSLNISLFYFHAYWLRKVFSQNKVLAVLKIVCLIAIEFIIYLALVVSLLRVLDYLDAYTGNPPPLNTIFFIGTSWRCAYFILLSTGYFFVMNYIRRQHSELTKTLEIERLEKELLLMEKSFLRSQINPHLLFNTLSFIKYAARAHPDRAEEAIDRLSEIMDHALEKTPEFTTLGKEVTQIENIIALSQLRYDQKLNILFKPNIQDPNIPIIPILLLTLIENLFKHGNLLDASHPAIVELSASPQKIIYKSQNLPASISMHKGSKTGLLNISNRLEKTYPGKFKFHYGVERDLYITELEIILI